MPRHRWATLPSRNLSTRLLKPVAPSKNAVAAPFFCKLNQDAFRFACLWPMPQRAAASAMRRFAAALARRNVAFLSLHCIRPQSLRVATVSDRYRTESLRAGQLRLAISVTAALRISRNRLRDDYADRKSCLVDMTAGNSDRTFRFVKEPLRNAAEKKTRSSADRASGRPFRISPLSISLSRTTRRWASPNYFRV